MQGAGAWCLKGGASGPLAIVCTRPVFELQWHSAARMGQGAGAPEAQCVVRGAWCDLKDGASGSLAIVAARPPPNCCGIWQAELAQVYIILVFLLCLLCP